MNRITPLFRDLRLSAHWPLLLLGLIFVMTAVSCHPKFLSGYMGAVVKPEDRLPLPAGGPHKNYWEGDDVGVEFETVREGDRLTLTGNVELFGGLEKFTSTRSFSVQAWFFDESARVVGRTVIFHAPQFAGVGPWSFRDRTELPPGTEGFTMSYGGEVLMSGDDRSGSATSFWYLPFE